MRRGSLALTPSTFGNFALQDSKVVTATLPRSWLLLPSNDEKCIHDIHQNATTGVLSGGVETLPGGASRRADFSLAGQGGARVSNDAAWRVRPTPDPPATPRCWKPPVLVLVDCCCIFGESMLAGSWLSSSRMANLLPSAVVLTLILRLREKGRRVRDVGELNRACPISVLLLLRLSWSCLKVPPRAFV